MAVNSTALDMASDLAELGTLQEVEDPPDDVWIPGKMPDAPAKSRQVLRSAFAHEQSGGGTTDVRRPIHPHSEDSAHLDPILALDDFTVALPDGFPDHAHRGFITLTYLLPSSPGGLTHEDFLGNAGTLHPGDAQWMTCGRGILHSEVPASSFFARGLQMWINLPEKEKMAAPEYLELPRARQLRAATAGVKAAVLAGEALGHHQDGPNHGPELVLLVPDGGSLWSFFHVLFFADWTSSFSRQAPWARVHYTMEPGAVLHQPIPEGHTAFIYTLAGGVVVADVVADAHHCLILSAAAGEDGVTVRTQSSEASFFLCAAKPLREPVVWQGPFVMCSEEQIRQSMLDYQCDQNGFERASSWNSRNKLRMVT
ncbi:PIR [Symbiodinium natans]|uniref:PIR protein n=1 Tax=Symbiodinium natans TaxID=878477 RepID=A0A812K5M0_9DINO|nr:PIR [Symbiodinium natans]